MKSDRQIAIIGLGAFGMALVKSLAKEGAQVIVRWDPKNPPKPGQTITVTANPTAVHLFSATTGERI